MALCSVCRKISFTSVAEGHWEGGQIDCLVYDPSVLRAQLCGQQMGLTNRNGTIWKHRMVVTDSKTKKNHVIL